MWVSIEGGTINIHMYIDRGCLNRNNMVFQEIVASYTIYEMHFSSSAPQREMGQNRNRNRKQKREKRSRNRYRAGKQETLNGSHWFALDLGTWHVNELEKGHDNDEVALDRGGRLKWKWKWESSKLNENGLQIKVHESKQLIEREGRLLWMQLKVPGFVLETMFYYITLTTTDLALCWFPFSSVLFLFCRLFYLFALA